MGIGYILMFSPILHTPTQSGAFFYSLSRAGHTLHLGFHLSVRCSKQRSHTAGQVIRFHFLSLTESASDTSPRPYLEQLPPNPLYPYQHTHTQGETCSKNVSLSKQVLAIERHHDVHGIYLKWSFAFVWRKEMYKVNALKANLSRDRYLALSPSSVNQLKS